MRAVFVDASYWIAVIDSRDVWHDAAVRAMRQLGKARFITTDSVVFETLNAFGETGAFMRVWAARYVRDLLQKPGVEVVAHDRDRLRRAIDLYEQRPDKGYSLTDCLSFQIMRERGVREALTTDRHFAQEGFVPLIEV